ncbi:BgTH12-05301 [Blumeria graminis f. sp. triticale]|uniref:BgTH12-05301 n=1 Tax=Blumeria graminis f. sp. triticale TaxID=1689686 RepID=A0A9W4D232_BLUGR|nr:BgTH12-05301 [Blumeria graminis f. sp. triticale]
MVPSPTRLRVLSVGGNAVSAFLSWRLQATNACDVTLVWKSGFDVVSQYGLSFKSTSFGNERFKPRHVVRAPEEAANRKKGAFDYVLLCVKALPDVYDLASIIESVVTPQHTCILLNTTHTLGVEAQLEKRFPGNVVLSLVSGAEITQLGAGEFEHKGSTDIWVGPANSSSTIPSSTQSDMANALAMTLSSGQVNCHVSSNIRQQQYERMIGPIAFHPMSVIFETPSHAVLVEKIGVRVMISDVIDELLSIAKAQGCSFPTDFKEKTIEEMLRPIDSNSIMYQDFIAKRPLEVETYLGSPIKLAQSNNIRVPRIETLYAILHHLNIVNQQRKDFPTVTSSGNTIGVRSSVPPPRLMNGTPVNCQSSGPPSCSTPLPVIMPPSGPPTAGRGRGRASSMNGPPPGMVRRGPTLSSMNSVPQNGYGRSMSASNTHPPQRNLSRRGSLEVNDLEEFSHLVLYDDIPESGESAYGVDVSDLALRERELALRQRELALREQEMRLKINGNPARGPRRGPPTPSVRNGGFDEDDDDDYFEPVDSNTLPTIDPDNFDMMSVTSRRHRKATPNQREIRKNPEFGDVAPAPVRRSNVFSFRQGFSRNRASARMTSPMPGLHVNLIDDPLLGYSSNRYGNVDRAQMGLESRSNSLTAARLDELQSTGNVPTNVGGHYQRRTSNSPGNPYGLGAGRGGSRRPSPSNGEMGPPGNDRTSPPGAVRQPVPRHPPGQANLVAPHQVEQYAGVSALHPPKGPVNFRSLTGSASASAASGDSANIDSEPSANSSQSSFGPRPPIGVR